MRVYLVTLLTGLGLIAMGLWLFAPWLSLTVVGCLLFGGSVAKLNNHRGS